MFKDSLVDLEEQRENQFHIGLARCNDEGHKDSESGSESKILTWEELSYGSRFSNSFVLMSSVQRFNVLEFKECKEIVFACCSSDQFAERMTGGRPYSSRESLFEAAEAEWGTLSESQMIEAFQAHPRIGEGKGGGGRFAKWSKGEQSGLGHGVSPDQLREANLKYEVTFGFRFLTSATGKTGEVIYDELVRRTERTREVELTTASEQQQKITRIRLEKALADLGHSAL
ncbi:hypothetical protein NDN08_000010 [Rhodosorus marinus]|uniref:2-oxo-4-hydroxy-4-carboxy-5-ureidoimidazoline decarboxylase n=1 Tax=Rhodosorus marinus TaxID=101924 RepID=A0AAV8UDY8_9RHOD|nr:hypothetical protein NDN08_000010 [Rhodosorus marinus]